MKLTAPRDLSDQAEREAREEFNLLVGMVSRSSVDDVNEALAQLSRRIRLKERRT